MAIEESVAQTSSATTITTTATAIT
jgi:hypothetical protein